MPLVGEARFVLLGEASHGTHEIYRERARTTQRLVAELGFAAVAIQGDWPDSYRVNRFVRGRGTTPRPARRWPASERFPTWMWRNRDVLDFVGWLHECNRRRPPAARRLLRPGPVQPARFDGRGAGLLRVHRPWRRAALARRGSADEEDAFDTEQNALLVKNAEACYRSMYWRNESSWNLRDSHMAQALQAVDRHLGCRGGEPARIVVWAHNSHLGDARATEMGQQRGEHNLGQLTRERFSRETLPVGFTTHTGSVAAAADGDAPAQRRQVLPSRPDSCERLLHATGLGNFMLPCGARPKLRRCFASRCWSAIGVVYRPATERQSHYFSVRLADQFDAVIHIDRSQAVQPLEHGAHWHDAEAPETCPSGL